MCFIFFISSRPAPSLASCVPDYILHSVGYLVFYLFAWLGFHGLLPSANPFKIILFAFLLTCLYGLSDEYHQAFVPSRDASLLDVLADFAGGFTGIALSLSVILIKPPAKIGSPSKISY
jgi:VanZ family protein